jgi:hypothetical protein
VVQVLQNSLRFVEGELHVPAYCASTWRASCTVICTAIP